MGITVKKRHLITATLICALAAAIFVNRYYTSPKTAATSGKIENTTMVQTGVDDASLGDAQLVNASANKYFSEAKIKRNEAHDEALEALNDVIKDSSSDAQAVLQAQKSLSDLSNDIKLEADIENLITAKLGSECLAVINGEKIEIIVSKGVVNETVNTQIVDIILKQNEKFSENITIIETK